jgi:hypothetical protein
MLAQPDKTRQLSIHTPNGSRTWITICNMSEMTLITAFEIVQHAPPEVTYEHTAANVRKYSPFIDRGMNVSRTGAAFRHLPTTCSHPLQAWLGHVQQLFYAFNGAILTTILDYCTV